MAEGTLDELLRTLQYLHQEDPETVQKIALLTREVVTKRITGEQLAGAIRELQHNHVLEAIDTEYLRRSAFLYWNPIFNYGLTAGQPPKRLGIPPCPSLTKEQAVAFNTSGMEIFYIPPEVPPVFLHPTLRPKPSLNDLLLERMVDDIYAVQGDYGKWIAVDITQRPFLLNQEYGRGNDPIQVRLGLPTRFQWEWVKVITQLAPRIADILAIPRWSESETKFISKPSAGVPEMIYIPNTTVNHLTLREYFMVAAFCTFKRSLHQRHPDWEDIHIRPHLPPIPEHAPCYLASDILEEPPDLQYPKTFEWIAERTKNLVFYVGYSGLGQPPQVACSLSTYKDPSIGFRCKVDLHQLAAANQAAQSRERERRITRQFSLIKPE